MLSRIEYTEQKRGALGPDSTTGPRHGHAQQQAALPSQHLPHHTPTRPHAPFGVPTLCGGGRRVSRSLVDRRLPQVRIAHELRVDVAQATGAVVTPGDRLELQRLELGERRPCRRPRPS